MKRVGYDADSGKYHFKDRNGSQWEGAEGAQYSVMKQGACWHSHKRKYTLTRSLSVVNSAPIALDGAIEDSEDIEAAGADEVSANAGFSILLLHSLPSLFMLSMSRL